MFGAKMLFVHLNNIHFYQITREGEEVLCTPKSPKNPTSDRGVAGTAEGTYQLDGYLRMLFVIVSSPCCVPSITNSSY